MMTPRSGPPSSVTAGSVAAIAAAARRITLKVPTRLIWMTRLKVSSGSTPSRPRTLPGVAMPAQFTTIRSGPSADGGVDGGLHLRLVGDVGGDKDGPWPAAAAAGVRPEPRRSGVQLGGEGVPGGAPAGPRAPPTRRRRTGAWPWPPPDPRPRP